MFLASSCTNPGSRVPDDRSRLETRKCQSERKCGQFIENSSTTKRRSQRRITHRNSKYQLGRSRTCKAPQNISEIFENIICDQRAGLRENQGMCSKQGSRGQHVDRCYYHHILFSATRQSLSKSFPGIIHEPIPFESILSPFNFSFVNSS